MKTKDVFDHFRSGKFGVFSEGGMVGLVFEGIDDIIAMNPEMAHQLSERLATEANLAEKNG